MIAQDRAPVSLKGTLQGRRGRDDAAVRINNYQAPDFGRFDQIVRLIELPCSRAIHLSRLL